MEPSERRGDRIVQVPEDGAIEFPEALPPPPSTASVDHLGAGPDARPTGSPEAARRRRRRAWVIAAGSLAAVVAIVLAVASMFRGSTADLLSVVPADVDLAVVVSLDPSAGQKANLLRLRESLPSGRLPGEIEEVVEEAGEGLLAGTGLRADDVTSWLGVEVAFVLDAVDGRPEFAVVAHADDVDAARRMVAKLAAPGGAWEELRWTERDVDGATLRVAEGDHPQAYAFDGDVVVLGSDATLVERILGTARGRLGALSTASWFRDAELELPDGRLVGMFANPTALAAGLDDLSIADDVAALAGVGDLATVRSLGVAVSAEPEGLVVDAVAVYDPITMDPALADAGDDVDAAHPLLGTVPTGASGVYVTRHADLALETLAEELAHDDPSFARDLSEAGLTGTDGLASQMTGEALVALVPSESGDGAERVAIVAVEDPDAAEQVLLGVAAALGERDRDGAAGSASDRDGEDRVVTSTHEGHTITAVGPPGSAFAYTVARGLVVIGTTQEQVRAAVDAIVDDAAGLPRALGDRLAGFTTGDSVVYVEGSDLLASLRAAIPPRARARIGYDERIAPELRAVRWLVGSVEIETRSERARFVLSLGEKE